MIKVLDFTFSIVQKFDRNFEIKICLSRGEGEGEILAGKLCFKKFESYFSTIP